MARAKKAKSGGERLMAVREGMEVRDVDGHRLGTVRTVYLGTTTTPGGPAATDEAPAGRGTGFMDLLASTLARDPLPEELRERLRVRGFIRIDTAGIFAADRYALPDQIAEVTGDAVTLSAHRDDLISD